MSKNQAKTVVLEDSHHKAFVEFLNGNLKGRRMDLTLQILSLGRTPSNDIALPSTAVSRVHAYLKKTEKGWLLQDNKSKNGIRVNGHVVEEAVLRTGDLIQVGDFQMRFEDPSQEEAKPEPSLTRSGKKKIQPLPVTPVHPVFPMGNPATIDDLIRRMNERRQRTMQIGLAVSAVLLAVGLVVIKIPKSKPNLIPVPASTTSQSVIPSSEKSPVRREPTSPRTKAIAKAEEELVTTVIESEAPITADQEQALAPSQLTADDLKVVSNPKKMKDKEPQDIQVYLKEGLDYLKDGDFESAIMAFNFALVIDPKNIAAQDGLRAAGSHSRQLPPSAQKWLSENFGDLVDSKQKVNELMKSASAALSRKSYSEAIAQAEKIRTIEVKNETAYLNEAKQIIDRARLRQKEEFEPFLEDARRKYEGGDFSGSRDLCQEMLKLDPQYGDAKDCLEKATRRIIGGKP